MVLVSSRNTTNSLPVFLNDFKHSHDHHLLSLLCVRQCTECVADMILFHFHKEPLNYI